MIAIKITLRKWNSVTSIVLYIYNIYQQVMGEYEIELTNLLDYINLFGKTDSAARVSLSRMVKSGILINKKRNGNIYYILTQEGLSNINQWNNGIERFFKRFNIRHKEWDQEWTTLTMINFKKSKEKNQFILDNLWELGYREIDNNVWFSPYIFKDEIDSILTNNKVNYLVNRGTIEINYDWNKFIESTYHINDLRKKYIQFINNIGDMRKDSEKQNMEDKKLLPVLFKLGWNFYDIVTDDPALPLNILDNWVGDRSVIEMGDFREYLVKRVSNYFKNPVI